MLSSRESRLQDWALFCLLALVPTLLIGTLGYRAVANEEAALIREEALALAAKAERATQDIDVDIQRLATDLQARPPVGDTVHVYSELERRRLPYTDAVVLSAERIFQDPNGPSRSSSTAFSDAPPACASLVGTAANNAEARAQFIATCKNYRSPSGRFLWPVFALQDLKTSPANANEIIAWFRRHVGALSPAEREVNVLEIRHLRNLSSETQNQLIAAFNSEIGATSLQAIMRQSEIVSGLMQVPDAQGMIRWRRNESVGIFTQLNDGRLAGFVLHEESIKSALQRNWLGLPTSYRATVTNTISQKQTLPSTSLESFIPIAAGLAIQLRSDIGLLVQTAHEKRLLLLSVGVLALLLSLGFAAALFAGMLRERRTSQLKTDFVSAVSHELRTPVASVRMLAELLEQGRVTADETQEIYQAMVNETKRLGETIQSLLSFSRMAANKQIISRERVDLTEMVHRVANAFEERHPTLPKLKREIEADLVANIDPAQVGLCLSNLLENARKYASAGAPYTLRAQTRNASIDLSVIDTGPGIHKRYHAKIFQPFERADDRLSQATEGTGIGLAIVKHVAEAHGGSARVQSELNNGATFTITLPRGEA